MMDIPEGFVPITRVSPVIEMIGPVYTRGTGLDIWVREQRIVRASGVFLVQSWPQESGS